MVFSISLKGLDGDQEMKSLHDGDFFDTRGWGGA